jgi:hypothetical protein
MQDARATATLGTAARPITITILPGIIIAIT